jgi:hypothetical protein
VLAAETEKLMDTLGQFVRDLGIEDTGLQTSMIDVLQLPLAHA